MSEKCLSCYRVPQSGLPTTAGSDDATDGSTDEEVADWQAENNPVGHWLTKEYLSTICTTAIQGRSASHQGR